MSRQITKSELASQCAALRTENSALRSSVEMLKIQIQRTRESAAAYGAAIEAADVSRHYPLTDGRGRAYRLEGRIKCFRP